MLLHSAVAARDLLKLYHAVYVSGSASKAHFLDVLHSHVVVFDGSFYNQWLSTVCDESAKMRSNGSGTGIASDYRFGPVAAIQDIENRQKHQDRAYLTIVCSFMRKSGPIGDNGYVLRYGESYDEFFNLLKTTSCHLQARPFVWLYLLADDAFVELLISHKKHIESIISTDWEPFFKSSALKAAGIFINDCMIDWKTGLNFYTCGAGRHHVVPMFVNDGEHVFNWLNLYDKTAYYPSDIAVGSWLPHICDCGLIRYAMTVKSRSHAISNLPLAEQLTSRYYTIQFIRDAASTHIFYSVEGAQTDSDKQLFEQNFSNIIYHRDEIAMTGIGKWPAFWDIALGPFTPCRFDFL